MNGHLGITKHGFLQSLKTVRTLQCLHDLVERLLFDGGTVKGVRTALFNLLQLLDRQRTVSGNRFQADTMGYSQGANAIRFVAMILLQNIL